MVKWERREVAGSKVYVGRIKFCIGFSIYRFLERRKLKGRWGGSYKRDWGRFFVISVFVGFLVG